MVNIVIGVGIGLFGWVLGVLWKTFMFYLDERERYFEYRGGMFWYHQGRKK